LLEFIEDFSIKISSIFFKVWENLIFLKNGRCYWNAGDSLKKAVVIITPKSNHGLNYIKKRPLKKRFTQEMLLLMSLKKFLVSLS